MRVLAQLRESNPQYAKAITHMTVDWDAFGTHPVSTSRKIPRRSTLVLIKGGKEVARLVAETDEAKIKAMLDKAVAKK